MLNVGLTYPVEAVNFVSYISAQISDSVPI